MKKMFVRATVVALVWPAAVGAQSCPVPAALVEGIAEPLASVRYLAADALQGRGAGTAGERCAGDFIAHEFERAGLSPGGENGTWFQTLPLASTLNPHATGGTGRNVIGILRGSDAALREDFIVVGAHYDHLAMGGPGSLQPGATAVHNGADDNASGVAAMLATARALADGPPPRRSVLFIAFTGEEMGLLGSAYFVSHASPEPDRMKAMLNMDMVGRLGAGPLIVYGVGTAEEWNGVLTPAAAAEGVALATRGEGYGPSDHTSFYTRDIPVLHFFTNVHGDYHQPGDDWEKVDAAGLAKVSRIVTSVARALADRPQNLTLVRGAGAPAPGAGEQRGYGAYLGSVPDFTPVPNGVLLSGVGPDSPADEAGIRAGDIIVGLGTHDVADLQGLTDALRAHRPGDTVELRYVRDGREDTVTVTLGSRSR